MSGLIWGALGKGMSDAASSYGSLMMQEERDKRALALEELRSENAAKREEARETRKAEREEAALRRDAEIVSRAEDAAPGIGDQRRFEKFKKDVGQTDMSEEQLRKVFDEQYNQQRVGSFEGADRYLERYSKQREDVLNEIRRMGGSGSAIKEARESVKYAQAAEEAAAKEARENRRFEQQERKNEQTAAYQGGMVEAAMRRADAAATAANRPPAEGRGSSQERLTTIINTQNQTIKSLNDGSRGKTPEEKAEWESQMAQAKKVRAAAQKQLDKLFETEEKPDAPKAKPGDNPKTTAGSPYPEGTKLKDAQGNKFVVKNGKPVPEK